jgi:hypothetical protein
VTATEPRAIPNYDTGAEDAPPAAPARNGQHRPPPHDLNLEAALIGAALLNPARALEHLAATAGAIYSPNHQIITAAILHVADRGDDPNPVIVAAHLHATGHSARIPDRDLVELQSAAAFPPALPAIARQLHELHRRRQLLHAAHELEQAAHGGDPDTIARWQNTIAEQTAAGGPAIVWEDVAAAMRGDTPPLLPTTGSWANPAKAKP